MKNLCKFVLVLGLMFSSFAFGQNVGEMHNSALKEYNKNYGFQNISNIKEMNQRLLSINKTLYPDIFKNVTIEQIDQFTLLMYGTDSTADFNYKTQMKVVLDNAVTEREVSENFKNLILKLIDDNDDVETSVRNINEYLNGGSASLFEKEILSNGKDVLNSSDAFWTNYENGSSNQNTARCNPKHQVRLADFCGGVMGGLLGSAIAPGVGSIFGGAAGSQGMSALVESMQDSHGGRCI